MDFLHVDIIESLQGCCGREYVYRLYYEASNMCNMVTMSLPSTAPMRGVVWTSEVKVHITIYIVVFYLPSDKRQGGGLRPRVNASSRNYVQGVS